ncbi:MAG: phosphatidate cytidylyltransferase [Bacteroidota bacterium]
MNVNLKFYIGYALVYGLILLVGEGSYRFLRVKPEWSRNFSHLAAGMISLPYPWIFTSHWWVLLLAVQSSVVLFLTRNLNLLPSHHLSGSNSAGSYLFFASLYICFLASSILNNAFFFVLPMLVLSIGDVMAAIIGREFGKKDREFFNRISKEDKTREGSIAFFLSTALVVSLAYFYYLQVSFYYALLMALVISVTTAFTEAVSTKGYDNFFIPLITLFIMYLEASI